MALQDVRSVNEQVHLLNEGALRYCHRQHVPRKAGVAHRQNVPCITDHAEVCTAPDPRDELLQGNCLLHRFATRDRDTFDPNLRQEPFSQYRNRDNSPPAVWP